MVMLHQEFSYNKCEMRQSIVTKQHPQTEFTENFQMDIDDYCISAL